MHEGICLAYRGLIRLRLHKTHKTANLCGQNQVITFQQWNNGGIHDAMIVVDNFSNRKFPSHNIGSTNIGEWDVVFNNKSCDDCDTNTLQT